jgi:hypothetical protein
MERQAIVYAKTVRLESIFRRRAMMRLLTAFRAMNDGVVYLFLARFGEGRSAFY